MKDASPRDRLLLSVAVLLMVGGVVMLFADLVSGGITIPLMTVGIALVVVAEADGRRDRWGRKSRGV